MTAADTITLTGLRAFGHHGVLDSERQAGQEFLIDVTIWLDFADAISTDDVTKTIHYGELAEKIVGAVASDPVNLIETVAERVAAIVLTYDRASSTRVTIHKPSAPITVPFGDVAVSITRDRR